MIIRHIRSDTEQGKLLLITIQWWQLLAGVSKPLWGNPTSILPYLEPNWLTSVRTFLRYSHGSLHIQDTMRDFPAPTRVNDQCIMDTIINLPSITASWLRAFNRCRVYMQVTYLSEISTADGLRIARTSWIGQRLRNHPLLWPQQPAPGPNSFRIWRRLLATAFLLGHRRRVCSRTVDLVLHQPLRAWLPESSWLRSSWTTFFSTTTRQLYRASNHTFESHSKTLGPRTRGAPQCIAFHLEPHDHDTNLPIDAVPIDLEIQPRYLSAPRTIPSIQPASLVPLAASWDEYIALLAPWEQELLLHTQILHSEELQRLLRSNHKVFLASDGGAQDPLGSYGCLLASKSQILAENGGQASGANPRSFRAEGYGMLAILRLLYHLLQFHDIPNIRGPVKIVCDSESLITRVETTLQSKICRPRRKLYSEADVEAGIIDTLQSLALNVRFQHVHSHPEKHHPNAPLSWDETLNTRCDTLATQYLDAATTAQPLVTFIPASKAHLQVNGTSITHHIPSQLRYLCNRQASKEYLLHRYGWTASTFESVDWNLFRTTFLASTFNLRLFIVKLVNHLHPLGYRQHRLNPHHRPSCPSCHHPLEDDYHLLHCTRASRRALISDVMQRLPSLFNRRNVDPFLRSLLRHALLLLLDPEHPDDPPDMLPDSHRPLFLAQQAIGWDHLFYGHFAQDWTTLQHQYLRFAKKPHNKHQAASFFRELISELWSMVHTLWLLRNEHLHGTSTQPLHSIKRLHLLSEISSLYDMAPSMLASDRAIFAYPLTDRQNHSAKTLRNYLRFAAPIVKRSISDATTIGTQSKLINAYFGPRFPIPPELYDTIHPLVDHTEYDMPPD
jgi:hypothetical protein